MLSQLKNVARRLAPAGIGALILGASLCSAAAAAEVKIGVFIPATGRFADLGEQMKDGYEIAFDRYRREKPTLNGEPLDLKVFYYDDEGKADVTLNAVTRALTQDKIDVATGFLFGEIFVRVMENFQAAGIPVVSCCDGQDVTSDLITSKKMTHIFQLSPTARDIVSATVAATVEDLKPSKIALLGENSLSGKAHAEIAKKWVAENAKDIEIVSVDLVPAGTTDFTPILSKIRRAGAQAIIGEMLGPSASILFGQWSDMKIPAVIAQHGGTTSGEDFIEANKKNVEGAIITNRWWPGRYSDLSEPMIAAFKDKYKVDPTNFSIQAFDSGIVAVEAVKTAGSTAPDKVTKALEDGTFVTAWGTRKFTPLAEGHRMPIDLVVVQIQNGKKVPIYPAHLATSLGTSFAPVPPYAWEKN